jgi:hypothetical protein
MRVFLLLAVFFGAVMGQELVEEMKCVGFGPGVVIFDDHGVRKQVDWSDLPEALKVSLLPGYEKARKARVSEERRVARQASVAKAIAKEKAKAEAKATALERQRAMETYRRELYGPAMGKLVVGDRIFETSQLVEETPVAIKVTLKDGVASIPMSELSLDDQKRFGYEPELAARWNALTAEEKAREQAAWFERRRLKREAEQKATGRE